MRNQKMYNYNFYNILKASSTSPIFPEFLLSKDNAKPNITIKECDFSFEKENMKEHGLGLNLKAWGGNEKLYVEFRKSFVTFWRLLLADLKKETKVLFKKNKSLIFLPQRIKAFYKIDTLITHQILLIKLLQADHTLIHAGGCISQGGKAWLWPAMDDVGKSTTTRYFMKKGFTPICDDSMILSKEGYVYPFWAQGDIKEVISKHPTSSKVSKVYFLEKSKNVGVQKIGKKTIIEKILSSTLYSVVMEIPRRIFLDYCQLNDFNPIFVEEKMKQVLSKALEGCDYFLVYGTRENFCKTIRRT